MYKMTTANKEVSVTKKYCDVCGTELYMGSACSASAIKCDICMKDLCEGCIGHEEATSGDSRHGYCERCWEIGIEYLKEIEKHSNEIDKLHSKWDEECIKS